MIDKLAAGSRGARPYRCCGSPETFSQIAPAVCVEAMLKVAVRASGGWFLMPKNSIPLWAEIQPMLCSIRQH